jgi:hypothetical protein
VQRSISLLIERNVSVNYAAIAREMGGISTQTLRTYPKVRMRVDEQLQSHHLYQLQQIALPEEQLLSQLEATISELKALGKPFTKGQLCEMLGKSPSGIKKYPPANALLKQKITRHHLYHQLREQPEERT